jgi:hypothetical protein
MASFTDNEPQVRREFQSLHQIFKKLASSSLPSNVMMKELSMGMSSDYKIALEEGSTLIRVGTSILGTRNVNQ